MIKRLESINPKFEPISCSAIICGQCGKTFVALSDEFTKWVSDCGWRWDSRQKVPLCPDCVNQMKDVKKER